jgi:hypothetical protein
MSLAKANYEPVALPAVEPSPAEELGEPPVWHSVADVALECLMRVLSGAPTEAEDAREAETLVSLDRG